MTEPRVATSDDRPTNSGRVRAWVRPTNRFTKVLWVFFDRGVDRHTIDIPDDQKASWDCDQVQFGFFKMALDPAVASYYPRLWGRAWKVYGKRLDCGCTVRRVAIRRRKRRYAHSVTTDCDVHGLARMWNDLEIERAKDEGREPVLWADRKSERP